jgi:DUF438 domain-containing protein
MLARLRASTNLAGAATTRTRTERIEILKSIIMELHDGGDPERVQKRFAEAVADVEVSEIAAMEEELIRYRSLERTICILDDEHRPCLK